MLRLNESPDTGNELIILCGPPCSGKSTFARDKQKQDKNVIILCRDDLRRSLFGDDYFKNNMSNRNEEFVTEIIEMSLLKIALFHKNKLVIIDSCNNKLKYINSIKSYAWGFGVSIKIMDYVPLHELMIRNNKRVENGHWFDVPFDVMTKMKDDCVSVAKQLTDVEK